MGPRSGGSVGFELHTFGGGINVAAAAAVQVGGHTEVCFFLPLRLVFLLGAGLEHCVK
jgi:hypothetical protein